MAASSHAETPRGRETATRDNAIPSFLKLGERAGYFTPLEIAGQGGMGCILKIQIHREDFVEPYVMAHLLSGDLSPRLLGIHGNVRLDDPEFEMEVGRRLAKLDRRSFLFQRLLDEMESREGKLVRAGYVAAAKIPLQDEGIASRFLREVRSLYKMGDHPNIVKYICCDVIENRPFLFTEYFPGADLTEVLRSSVMPIDWALKSFIAILKGVHHAHTRGIVHRDLKPSNILTDGKDLKITDFGLAKSIVHEEDRTQLTMADQILGTPAYMAPEQANPKLGPVGEETDIYQLGITLFEMLTRRPMYDVREYSEKINRLGAGRPKDLDPRRLILEDVADLKKMHPCFPRDLVPEIPDEVEKLVMTLCQKEPLERFTCELALEHAAELVHNEVFAHAEPSKPPSEEGRKDHRTTLIFAASEALLAKHAYAEAQAYQQALGSLARAEQETDIIARAELLEASTEPIGRLPKAKFAELYGRFEALEQGMAAEKDDIEAFRPNRKIAMEIAAGFEEVVLLVEGDNFTETPVAEVRAKAQALRARAQQHLERVRRTGLPEKITGRYLAQLEATVSELPKLEERLDARRATFIRRKKEELRAAIERKSEDAILAAMALKRALETGDPDDEDRGLLEDLEKRILRRPDTPAAP